MPKTEYFIAFHVRRSARTLVAAVALIVFPLLAVAQSPDVLTSPPNIVVPNYEGIPVGPFAGLEASR